MKSLSKLTFLPVAAASLITLNACRTDPNIVGELQFNHDEETTTAAFYVSSNNTYIKDIQQNEVDQIGADIDLNNDTNIKLGDTELSIEIDQIRFVIDDSLEEGDKAELDLSVEYGTRLLVSRFEWCSLATQMSIIECVRDNNHELANLDPTECPFELIVGKFLDENSKPNLDTENVKTPLDSGFDDWFTCEDLLKQ